MRVRSILLLSVLLIPAGAQGQIVRRRFPRIGRPPAPAPLPPQSPEMVRYLQMRAVRTSFDAYPLFTFMETSGYPGRDGAAVSALYGMGLRLDYRLTELMSLTADFTSSYGAEPRLFNTVDLGGRWQANRQGYVVRPYIDARTSLAWTRANLSGNFGPDGFGGSSFVSGTGSSNGVGLLAGTGFDTPVTSTLFLTTGLSVARHYMSGTRVGDYELGTRGDYRATSIRFIVGLKYNARRPVLH